MKNLEELEVQIVESCKIVMQQDCTIMLQSNGQLLKEKASLSILTRRHTDFA